MGKNILIFRTDRIGDLIVTCPAIITIKKYFNNSNITLIASDKNFEYAKNLDIFDCVYKFPKNNIFNKIVFIYKLTKKTYDYIFVFDGKDRSIITSALIKSGLKEENSSSAFFELYAVEVIKPSSFKISEIR